MSKEKFYREMDQIQGPAFLDAFIAEINADHADVINVPRNVGCQMWDEILRLRAIESRK